MALRYVVLAKALIVLLRRSVLILLVPQLCNKKAKSEMKFIHSIPRVSAEIDKVCSSVNIGSTKSGINIPQLQIWTYHRETAALSDMGAAKVVFANADEDNPFMVGSWCWADVIIEAAHEKRTKTRCA